MKQKNTVVIRKIEINGEACSLAEPEDIELEFSAIDTGGGFHDPILDFTYELSAQEFSRYLDEGFNQITLYLQDPSDEENRLKISYKGKLKKMDDQRIEGMGRLKDDEMHREITKFVIRSVR